eukprot:COSAG06_NODE_804_length_12172_cov_15.171954_12_plen_116_part_00
MVASHQLCSLPACGGQVDSAAAVRAPPAGCACFPPSAGWCLSKTSPTNMRPSNASILAIFLVRSCIQIAKVLRVTVLSQRFYGVMVSTLDFESNDPGSNPGRTLSFLPFFLCLLV